MPNSPAAHETQAARPALEQPCLSLFPPTSGEFKPRIRRNFPRSKSGCLTCRSRRKKCDEKLPVCLNCKKRNVQCTWPLPIEQKGEACEENPQQSGILSHGNVQTPLRSPASCSIQNEASSEASALHAPFKSGQWSPLPPGISTRVWFLQWGLSYSRDSLVTPSSRLLLDRYLSQISSQLCAITPSRNPFVDYVLPLAFSNELVMNCILALSGAYSLHDDAVDSSVISATWSHYSLVLRDLRVAMSQHTHGIGVETLHLLLITVFLSLVDRFSGSPQTTVLHHLAASRHLILEILSTPSFLLNPDHLSLWGFLLEIYSYDSLTALITPRGNISSQTIIKTDSFLDLEGLRQYSSYGIRFGCGHDIFEFIPIISSLVAERLTDDPNDIHTPELYAKYQILASKLRDWKPVRVGMTMEQSAVAICYQNSLLIYLHSAFNSLSTNPPALAEIETRVGICFSILLSLALSQLEAMIFWPVMIIGSCVQKEEDRELIRRAFETSRYRTMNVRRALVLLNALWGDDDPRAYGPQGLDYIMKKRGWNLCLS